MSKTAEKKKKTSPDYPLLAQKLIEASGDVAASKLPAGLYVVATPIGHRGDITLRALLTLVAVDAVACEDTRTTGTLLAAYGIKQKLVSYHDHNDDARRPELLQQIRAGAVALVSDAGLPLIADPGFKLVRDCRKEGLDVFVIPGANAALTALAGSGIATDAFYFAGFLSPKSGARQTAIGLLKTIQSTLLFYEAPQRLAGSLKDLASILGNDRPASIARELTKLFEETKQGTLKELADFYADNDVRGEIVITVAPPLPDAEPMLDVDAILKDQLRTESLRDAVDAAVGLTGMKKSEVYARALWLSGKNSG